MQGLAVPTAVFSERKTKILQQLAVPDAEYADASPKGSVDEGIRDLIDEINGADGFVTTSSCAGRVSVYLEGRKSTAALSSSGGGDDGQVAGVGGKGGGGTWLFVSHDPVQNHGTSGNWIDSLGFAHPGASHEGGGVQEETDTGERRLIHFKFEPMILHVLTTSMAHAQLLLRHAIQAGFRESGAVNLTSTTDDPATPMVAIRSMGLSFESLIGHEVSSTERGHRERLVPADYLTILMDIANERFSENSKRIDRFRNGFRNALQAPPPKTNPAGEPWEDQTARRERMRAEGLLRKAAALDKARGDGEKASTSNETD